MRLRFGVLAALVLMSALPAPAPAAGEDTIEIDAAHVLNRVTPWMYGSCLEDVNHEIYGGLYAQKIFGESFEEPPALAVAGWKAYGGTWAVDGAGAFEVKPDLGAKLVRDAPPLTDGIVECDVRLASDQGLNAGLILRVGDPRPGADAWTGYEISLSASQQTLLLGRHRNDFQLLKSVPAPVTAGQWHHLRVEMMGPTLRIFLDGGAHPLIGFTDSDRPILAGQVGLRTWGAGASFRNLSLTSGTETVKDIPPHTPTPGETAQVSGLWNPLRTGHADARFFLDGDRPFNTQFSQRIDHGPGDGLAGVTNRGLNRWGIAVRRGAVYAGRLYLRQKGGPNPVTVALQSADGRRTYARQRLAPAGAAWSRRVFTLRADATDPNARFALWVARPGTLWVDQVFLSGTGRDLFHGLPIRADIAGKLQEEGITFLRYGGTMVNVPGYRWKNMIGDPDRRPQSAGNWYSHATNGFGIEEFLRFCEAAHIEAAFAINSEETAQDAAEMVDYLTGPVTTVWGRRRAGHGHPKPYRIHYIEIGNEEVLGADDPAAYDHYARRFQALSHAMHARNPALKLVCAAWWRPDSPNVERVFRAVNGEAAAWDLHVWADDAQSGTAVDQQLTQMQARFQQWVPGTPMAAVIFEENGGLHNLRRALGHATVLNAASRHGDFVLVDCPANCLQPWKQNDNGWDQGQVFFTADHAWAMPPFYAQQMASENHLPLRVESQMTGDAGLDLTATRSEDGKTLALSVVNTSARSRRAAISLAGFPGGHLGGRVWTLLGDLEAVNPPDGRENVHPHESVLTGVNNQFEYTFPAHSYTVIRLGGETQATPINTPRPGRGRGTGRTGRR